MSKLVICRTDEVGGEFATRAVVDNKAYAVYKLGDEYFVSIDLCEPPKALQRYACVQCAWMIASCAL